MARSAPWRASNLGARAIYDAEEGQPKNVGYVTLDRAFNNQAIISPAVTGMGAAGADLDVIMCLAADVWAPGSGSPQDILSRSGTGASDIGWVVRLGTGGQLALLWAPTGDAGNLKVASSTVAVPGTNGQPLWVRVTHDVNNGASGYTVTFYTSAQDPTTAWADLTWIQLGTPVVAAGVTSHFALNIQVRIGESLNAPFGGKVYRALVRRGIDGETVAEFDARRSYAGGYTDTTPWIDANGAQYVPLTGLAGDHITCAHSAALNILGDLDIRADLAPLTWTPAASSYVVAKSTASTAYELLIETSGALTLRWHDGVALVTRTSTVPVGAGDLVRKRIRATLDVDNGAGGHDVTFHTADPGGPWVQLGDVVTNAGVTAIQSTASNVTVGSLNDSLRLSGRLYGIEIRNGIDGTVVAQWAATATTPWGYGDAYGNGWVNGSPKHRGQWQIIRPRIYDTSGNHHPPAVFAAAANAPVHLPWEGVAQVYFPATAGNRINAGSLAAFNVTDLDMWIDLTLGTFTPAGPFSIAQRMGSDPTRQWNLTLLANGRISFDWYPTGLGASLLNLTTTDPLSTTFGPGGRVALRVVLDVNNGAGGYTASIFGRSSAFSASWILLGRTVGGAPTALPSVSRVLEVGNAGSGAPLRLHRFQLRASIDGPVVADWDAARVPQSGSYVDAVGSAGASWFATRAATGTKMVVQSPTARSARSVVQFASSTWLEIPSSATPAFGISDPGGVSVVQRKWTTLGTNDQVATTKASTSGTSTGIELRSGATAVDLVAGAADGSTQATSTLAGSLVSGQRQVLTVGINASTVTGWVNNTPGAPGARPAGALDSGLAMRIAASRVGSEYSDMDLETVVYYDREPSAGDVANLVAARSGGS